MDWKFALFLAAPIAVVYLVNLGLTAVRLHLQKAPQELVKPEIQIVR